MGGGGRGRAGVTLGEYMLPLDSRHASQLDTWTIMIHNKHVECAAGFCPRLVMVQTIWKGTRTPTMSASSAAGQDTGPSSALACCLMARSVAWLACLHDLVIVGSLEKQH